MTDDNRWRDFMVVITGCSGRAVMAESLRATGLPTAVRRVSDDLLERRVEREHGHAVAVGDQRHAHHDLAVMANRSR